MTIYANEIRQEINWKILTSSQGTDLLSFFIDFEHCLYQSTGETEIFHDYDTDYLETTSSSSSSVHRNVYDKI